MGGTPIDILLVAKLIVGLVALVAGAESLVRGASSLARVAGIPPLLIGLTIVAYGTSAPEMAVSIRAALSSELGSDIAVANVIGSNIFNVLFILGISALIAPLRVSLPLVRRDVPLMVAASILTFFLAWDGEVSRLEGLLLLAGIILYTASCAIQGKQESREVERNLTPEDAPHQSRVGRLIRDGAFIAVGLALLCFGANWMVDSAATIARALGISELIIGLTLVAIGTSLPEVATSVVASFKGEVDIAVGNIVGSNIFNLLAVLGMSAAVAPKGVLVPQAAIQMDLPVMVAVAVVCLPIFFSGFTISRWEGGVFFAYYLAYTLFLFLSATHRPELPLVKIAILFFALPLTFVTVFIPAYLQWRRHH